MEKPKRWPLATWEFDEESEDKRTVQPETNKCFFPAVVIKHGCPDNMFTSGMFKCPETHTDGGDYTHCDLFSIWWWYHFGSGKRSTKPKTQKPKKKIIPDIKISKGDIPLISSNATDIKSTTTNWNKFKIRR